jgi:hypothetical protein
MHEALKSYKQMLKQSQKYLNLSSDTLNSARYSDRYVLSKSEISLLYDSFTTFSQTNAATSNLLTQLLRVHYATLVPIQQIKKMHGDLRTDLLKRNVDFEKELDDVKNKLNGEIRFQQETVMEMLRYIDRDIRKALKPVIPTTVLIENLHYPCINDFTDLDSKKNTAQVSEGKKSLKEKVKPKLDSSVFEQSDLGSFVFSHQTHESLPVSAVSGYQTQEKPVQISDKKADSSKDEHIQLLISTLESIGKDLMCLRNIIHAFYYKVSGDNSSKKEASESRAVPSIWADIEIVESQPSPLAASLPEGFQFPANHSTQDLRNIFNVENQDVFTKTQKKFILDQVVNIAKNEKRNADSRLPTSRRNTLLDKLTNVKTLKLGGSIMKKAVLEDEIPVSVREQMVYNFITTEPPSRKSVRLEELLGIPYSSRAESVVENRSELEVSMMNYSNKLFESLKSEEELFSTQDVAVDSPLNASLASDIDIKMRNKEVPKRNLPLFNGNTDIMNGKLPPINYTKQPQKVSVRRNIRKKQPEKKKEPEKEKEKEKRVRQVESKDPKGPFKRVPKARLKRSKSEHNSFPNVSVKRQRNLSSITNEQTQSSYMLNYH